MVEFFRGWWEILTVDVNVEFELFDARVWTVVANLAVYRRGFDKIACVVQVLVAGPVSEPVNDWRLITTTCDTTHSLF